VKTAYLGTSEFAVTVLEALAASPHRPGLVLTRPPRPSGRARRLQPTPVALAAERLGIEMRAPERLDDETAALAALAPGAICVCAYGALVREPLLSTYELINVHPSLLPRWRGAAPIERAILAGDANTGVSIMRLVAELDAGPIGAQEAVPITPQDDYGTLAARLAQLAAQLLLSVLDGPRSWIEQGEAGVTYAEKIAAADRVLDPQKGADELARRVRALHPQIGARTADGLGVLEARALTGDGAHGVRPAPGTLATADGRLLYGAANGALELLRVQPAGGRAMDAAAYIRGHAL
jgi:methionyl-tRNA formyltransferase